MLYDIYPTHKHGQFRLRSGKVNPMGASVVPGGINFAVYSWYATECTLVLFKRGEKSPYAEIPFLDEFRIGKVFAMTVFDINFEEIEYGYRMDGPYVPENGHRFDKSKILMDPYAKSIGGREIWGQEPDWDDVYEHRARVITDDFNWDQDRAPQIPVEDLIIYEMHVRGFTAHESSAVEHRGTFAGLREKIPYLLELGVNCVELMPIHEFDEFENQTLSPVTGEKLNNYWGYSNVGFFAPKAGYAATGEFGMEVDELKSLIKEFHRNGIEVVLDVVFNHTAEGNENGKYISYRGIDNKTFYMLAPDGSYLNFSGCGNTLNCNNPIVRDMILNCLRYWVSEYHIDGFRFDLASILGRAQDGTPLHKPPLLESLAFDPILGKCKLIAEAWDAGGLYQVGSFPAWGRWAEWNGKFRDDVRRFLKGDEGMVGNIASRVQGSPDLYESQQRGTTASINFITAHDGFTLMDLFSYNRKHNRANGEDNRDGSDHNFSWNCGAEGESTDPEINRLRFKMIKNAVTFLMVSQGIPMILSGDEFGNTQWGNNNVYCQDNEISWLNWELLEKNTEIFRYFQRMIRFRKAHPILRNRLHLKNEDYMDSGYPDISWHGVKAWKPDWSFYSRTLAFLLCGKHADGGHTVDNYIYVAMNSHWEAHSFELPKPPGGMKWYRFADTGLKFPKEIEEIGKEPLLKDQKQYLTYPRSVVILIGK